MSINRSIILILIILAGTLRLPASSFSTPVSYVGTEHELGGTKRKPWRLKRKRVKDFEPKYKRLKATLFTIFLGHFGVHRMYLGTDWKVPLFYALTLGGGLGLLPLIDLFCILFTAELSVYENLNQFFMWVK